MVASPINMNNNNMAYDQMRAQTASGDGYMLNNFA